MASNAEFSAPGTPPWQFLYSPWYQTPPAPYSYVGTPTASADTNSGLKYVAIGVVVIVTLLSLCAILMTRHVRYQVSINAQPTSDPLSSSPMTAVTSP